MKEHGKVLLTFIQLLYSWIVSLLYVAADGPSIVSLFFWESDPLEWVCASEVGGGGATKISLF